MEIYKQHKEQIKELLIKGRNIDDLQKLLNFIIEIQNENGGNYKPITTKKLTHYYYNLNKKYREFSIPKKSGGSRNICAPDKFLTKVLRRINIALSLIHTPTEYSHGFLIGRSIKTNAEMHVNKKYVLNVDVKDFFPSVNFFRIKIELQKPPFELNEKMAHLVANFCCYNKTLPQGAPTSPIVTNIICNELDLKLAEFAKTNKQVFTRYADDITFSGYRPIYDKDYFSSLQAILKKEKFYLKHSKTRIQTRQMRQEVTGVVVNEKLNVNRNYVRNLRALIHNYVSNKKLPDNTAMVIMGKLEFLQMIKGKEKVYLKLKNKFDSK
ncbi:reverse transcriptase family protein [Flavobacteriales bacterium]|nr:reverse transcriptase family protein [Flavobacteriales bacterium]